MSDDRSLPFTMAPSIKPTLAGIAATLAVEGLLIGGVYAAGLDQDTVETVAMVAGLLGVLVVLRLLLRMYVLNRTTYVITDTDVRREYGFLLRRSAREIPLQKLRGLHLSQTPLQTLFGHGDLQFLTAGPNGSLGFISFDNLPGVDDHRETIRELIQDASDE